MTAVLSVGSNLGDRLQWLQVARDAVAEVGPLQVSPVYETVPVGGPEQADFLNAVLVSSAELEPAQWLQLARSVEDAAGRVRSERWGPRTLDVDVVDVDGQVVSTPDLELPHPRAAERAFVLRPWLDIAPGAVLGGRPVAELLAAVGEAGLRRTSLVLA